jgi:hypothetical protein
VINDSQKSKRGKHMDVVAKIGIPVTETMLRSRTGDVGKWSVSSTRGNTAAKDHLLCPGDCYRQLS